MTNNKPMLDSAGSATIRPAGQTVLDEEECDDGNTDEGDGCSSDCLSEETCGDGYFNDYSGVDAQGNPRAAEICDDGNNLPDDGCNETCSSSGICGNGILDPGEACDYESFNGLGVPPPPTSFFCLPGAIGGQQRHPSLQQPAERAGPRLHAEPVR